MRSGENENWLTMWTRRPSASAVAIFSSSAASRRAGRNARMAFRIGADADLLDAGFAQAALLDHRQRIGEGTGRFDIAADHQQPAHIGFAMQAGEQIPQVGRSANAPCGDMDHRLQAGLAQQDRAGNQFVRL